MSVIHSTGSFLPIGSEPLAEFPAQDRSRSPLPEPPSAIEFDALGYLAPEASGPSKSEKDSSQVHMSLELPHTRPHAIYVGPPYKQQQTVPRIVKIAGYSATESPFSGHDSRGPLHSSQADPERDRFETNSNEADGHSLKPHVEKPAIVGMQIDGDGFEYHGMIDESWPRLSSTW